MQGNSAETGRRTEPHLIVEAVVFPNPSQILPKSFQTIWSDFFMRIFASEFQHRMMAEHGPGHETKYAYLYHRAGARGHRYTIL